MVPRTGAKRHRFPATARANYAAVPVVS